MGQQLRGLSELQVLHPLLGLCSSLLHLRSALITEILSAVLDNKHDKCQRKVSNLWLSSYVSKMLSILSSPCFQISRAISVLRGCHVQPESGLSLLLPLLPRLQKHDNPGGLQDASIQERTRQTRLPPWKDEQFPGSKIESLPRPRSKWSLIIILSFAGGVW